MLASVGFNPDSCDVITLIELTGPCVDTPDFVYCEDQERS